MSEVEFGDENEDQYVDELDPPVASKTIEVRPGTRLLELAKTLIILAESRDYRGARVFHPGDMYGKAGSRFVVRVEVDPEDPMKDLIMKPESDEAFRIGDGSPDSVVLQTSYRAPLLMNEEMLTHFKLVDELQPIVEELGSEFQARIYL